MQLLADIKERLADILSFISSDIALVSNFAEDLVVPKATEPCRKRAACERSFSAPRVTYTQALASVSTGRIKMRIKQELDLLWLLAAAIKAACANTDELELSSTPCSKDRRYPALADHQCGGSWL